MKKLCLLIIPNSKSYSTSAGKGARSLTETSITNLPDLRGQLISGRIIPNDTEGMWDWLIKA